MTEPAIKVVTASLDELRAIVREELRAELGQRAANDVSTSKLLTTQEAADYCGMSKRAFLHHVTQGRVVPDSPARAGFSTHRFKRSTLDAFLVGKP